MDTRADATGRELPAGRYGSARPRPGGRVRRWVIAGVGVLFGCGIAYLGYVNLGSPPIDAERTGYSPLDATSIKITFDVTRDSPGKPAECVVRAVMRDGTEGGRREVFIPPGGSSTRISAVIRSSGEPVTADVFGCTYQVPPYLSTGAPPTE
ncbi:DUF4307 domain-containing protein [Actinocrispum wychmicini]|uniref:DUF4307 domain-containing protein n=1 Tax=Actinocrispum wychmicini TaxID=1213861 RepID=UPI001051DE2F|nr:DUF4307 domain-containing protein [Actinocrispum wychmicini]